MAYRLSKLAEFDLEDIGIYTVYHWGFDQWVAYLSDLTDAFEMLGRFPNLGKVLPQTQAHVRSYAVNKHMIRYTIEPDDSITIVRVLYVRRLPT